MLCDGKKWRKYLNIFPKKDEDLRRGSANNGIK